jgi:hypothetical protein
MHNIELFRQIFIDIHKSKEKELVNDLIGYAVRYAQIRVEWMLSDVNRRIEIDNLRTNSHDAFIDSCNILSRQMGKLSEDNSWRQSLGNGRKTIGDFACYIHYALSIKAR